MIITGNVGRIPTEQHSVNVKKNAHPLRSLALSVEVTIRFMFMNVHSENTFVPKS